jgi:hypothetical protein
MSVYKIILVLGLSLSASIANAACPRFTAPSQFDNTPASWGNDSGPIVAGFVDSKRPAGSLFDLIHGVDLDSYNAVDYSQIINCGGKFAIVRTNQHANNQDSLDTLFSDNMAGLARQQTSAFPYFFFALPDELRKISKYKSKLSDSDEAQYRKSYESAGVQAAQTFLNLLTTAKYSVPINEIAGLKGHFVAVDVEQTPSDASQSNQIAAKYYGTFYSAAVCSWIKAVTGELPQLVPVLYTFPAVYGDYLQFADADVNACLQGLPVWVARTYGNGWEAIRETDPSHCTGSPSLCTTDRLVQKLCEIQSGNRCIIHQYTHRGTAIAIGRTPKSGIPPHIDLDRFYTAKTVTTNAGTQFVRIEDAFKP